MPKVRKIINGKKWSVRRKFRVGGRDEGPAGHLLSDEDLNKIIANDDKKKHHHKAKQVLDKRHSNISISLHNSD